MEEIKKKPREIQEEYTNLISLIFKVDFKTSYSYYHNFSICRELCGLRTNFFEVPRVNFDIFTLIW